MPTTIGVKNEEILYITFFFIAYPKPVIQWVFTSDITNTTIESNSCWHFVHPIVSPWTTCNKYAYVFRVPV
jgi:hypothetical protein